MNEKIGKSPAQLGVGYYLKHLAIAFAVGFAILAVTYLGLALMYGPFIPFKTGRAESHVIVVPSSVPSGGR